MDQQTCIHHITNSTKGIPGYNSIDNTQTALPFISSVYFNGVSIPPDKPPKPPKTE